MQKPDKRGHWNSKIGFIFAAAGSAVGLGNIWRFPYMTGENGGAAFVIVYLLCVFFIGLPLLYNELALGRASQANPIGAFRKTMPGTPFFLTGVLCLLLCFVVLSYYGVIAGWAIGYAVNTLVHKKMAFEEFVADPARVIPMLALFILMTILIVQAGIESGIEKWSKVLMPLLFVMMVGIILRSLTLEGAMKGVAYYLKPDFSKINGHVVLMALGQAFFSLSVGWGLMITYGSYMPRSQSIITSGFWVAFADTAVALLGGLMVFPAVFAFGLDPAGGPALTFTTLPEVFEKMPAGTIVGTLFFVLLTIAALTSSISMLEVPVSYIVDEKKKSRKMAAWTVGILAFVAGIPSALSQGGSEWFTNVTLFGQTGWLNILDYVFGTVLVVVIALLCSVYVGWIWKLKNAVHEIHQCSPHFTKPIYGGVPLSMIWGLFIQYICPLVILIVLLGMLGAFQANAPETPPPVEDARARTIEWVLPVASRESGFDLEWNPGSKA